MGERERDNERGERDQRRERMRGERKRNNERAEKDSER